MTDDWLNTSDTDGGSWLGSDDPPHPGAPDVPVPTATQPSSGGWLDDSAASEDPFGAPMEAQPQQSQAGGWMDGGSLDGGDGYLGMGSELETAPSPYDAPHQQAGPPAPRQAPPAGMAPAGSSVAPGEFAVDAPYLQEVQPGRRTLSTKPRGTLTDLVLDVPVPVEVSFGDAMLTVEDFLELGPGAVVELDRAIEAPVELRVRGKLIAHGQLVTVNGRYGLRVTRMAEEN